jgi:hypothetical protein
MDEVLEAHWRTFGAHLKRLIETAHLTVSEFANRADITLTQASRILNGQSGTRRTTLPRFVRALRLTDRKTIRELYAKAGFLPPADLTSRGELGTLERTHALGKAEQEELISLFEDVPPHLRPNALRVLKAFIDSLPEP